MKQTNVKPADGKLGIMVVGCGAVATTFMTGVFTGRTHQNAFASKSFDR